MTVVGRDLHDRSDPVEEEPWRLLHRYWLSKHVDGHPPAREDIDPITEIPRLVANLMLIDATAEGFVYRFVGTEAVTQTGQDMTGQHAGLSRKYASVQSEFIAALDFVRVNGQPRLLMYRFDVELPAKQFVLLLPLHTVAGGVVKILGGAFFGGYFPPNSRAEDISVTEVPL